MSVKLLTEHLLEVLSLTGGCTGSYESTLVKMSNCWKSHAAAQFIITPTYLEILVSTYFSDFLMEDMFSFKHVLECIPVKCHPTEKEEICK